MKQEWKDDEVLEAVWTAEEKENPSLETVRGLSHVPVTEHILERLARGGLIERSGSEVRLSEAGREKTRTVIRRHRLAERLLHDVLSMRVEDTEAEACEFEHVLAPEVTESICTLLGHPRQCPHGSPIPEGRCCLEARSQVSSLVVPLTELATGESARVSYINTSRHPRLHKLISFGVAPGATVRLHQKYPSYIIQSENTELALEEEVARDIYVRRGS